MINFLYFPFYISCEVFLYVWSVIFLGRIPFSFLEDIHQKFVRTYGRAVHSAKAYAMNDEFSRVLSQQLEYYSNDPSADRINRIKGEMNEVSDFSVYLSHGLKSCMVLILRVFFKHILLCSKQVRGVMIENIDKVLDRGERLELLVDATENMQGNTYRFRKQTRRLRSNVWWRNCKLMYVLD